ncbi:class I SAM-dependent methyltransferase [Aspergillus undulatus]|uniref:class I SAM-dependent methyltransferase n=1 Tax=Aspergillus undulatus TaxID=1810928 RepID=UPI003CCD3563
MTSQPEQQLQKDHWSSEAYTTSASFVPKLTSTLLRYLDPQPTDSVLDIGCGDGKFTALFLPHVGRALGVDASAAMIGAAERDYGDGSGQEVGGSAKAQFRVLDCCLLDSDEGRGVVGGGWDKVVSNAALHWILCNGTTRTSTLKGIHAALKPSGKFIFEMGGHGNVGEVNTALMFALRKQGIPMEKIKEVYPWYFPSAMWMATTLESIGFKVHVMETEYRPTELTRDKGGGLAGWVRLMGASFLEILSEGQREEAVRDVCEVLESVVTRSEDGSQWLGYVRLRGVAEKI